METVKIQRDKRKFKDILATSGYGVVIFIIWGFIKELLYLRWVIPNTENIDYQIFNLGSLIFGVIILGICLTTGLLAKQSGKSDKKEKPILIVFAFILALLALVALAADAALFIVLDEFDLFAVFSFIADILFNCFVLQIVISFFVLRKLYKKEEANNER